MKALKRFAAAVMAAAMLVVASAAPAFADTYDITINGTAEGHEYEAYQVFSGDLDGLVLSNIVWGDGVNGDALIADLKADTYFGAGAANRFYNCATAKDVATVLAEATFRANQANVERFADVAAGNLIAAAAHKSTVSGTVYTITVDAPGYYLIKDADGTVSGYDSYTKYVLEIVANTTVSPKSAVPTLTKKVSSDNVNFANATNSLYNTKVYFELIGTMPSNISSYDSYYYEMRDVLPAGLTANVLANSELMVLNNGVETFVPSSMYDVVSNPDGDADTSDFSIVIWDVKDLIRVVTGYEAITEDQIVFTYEAVVDYDAVLGLGSASDPGNKNIAYLLFSNDPNEAYAPAGKVVPSVGATPQDVARVYTYQLSVNKVDEQDTSLGLKNAQFRLYRIDGTTTMYAVAEETVAGSGVYRYLRSTTNVDEATLLTTNANGGFVIKGISARALHLEETTAPAGYNKPSEHIGVTISAHLDTAGGLAALNGILTSGTSFSTVSSNVNTGNVTVTISNTKGQTLPETGGMGTTVFYLLGAIMVIGAATVLVRRKRSSDRH